MRLIGFRCTEQRSAASVWTAHSFSHRAAEKKSRRRRFISSSFDFNLVWNFCVCLFFLLSNRPTARFCSSRISSWDLTRSLTFQITATHYGFICCSFISYQEWKTDQNLNLLLLKTWCILTTPVNRCPMISFIWSISFCNILVVETQYLHISMERDLKYKYS